MTNNGRLIALWYQEEQVQMIKGRYGLASPGDL
jgi:hypothetical protein